MSTQQCIAVLERDMTLGFPSVQQSRLLSPALLHGLIIQKHLQRVDCARQILPMGPPSHLPPRPACARVPRLTEGRTLAARHGPGRPDRQDSSQRGAMPGPGPPV
jgi:hypothetical protein